MIINCVIDAVRSEWPNDLVLDGGDADLDRT